MQVKIKKGKASSILFEGKFYDTEVPLNLTFSEAFRLSRIADTEAIYDRVEYDPSLWADQHFINFFGDVDGASGFGGVSHSLVKFSAPRVISALAGRVFGVRDQIVFGAQNRELNQAGAIVWHDQPRESWVHSPFKKNIGIVPFETTLVPPSWLGRLERLDALFAPCEQNIQMFRDSGVRIPIELIHWGVDEKLWYPLERSERDIFTFGHLGALSIRKGTDVLIDAFRAAFPKERDVRLVCKTSHNNYPFDVRDDRIKVHMTEWPQADILNLFYKEIDCFVFPTRGEGFGLTPLEAMATGVPAIVTGWSGPMEYMNPEVGWLLDYKMVPATAFSEQVYHEPCGDWAEPNKDHLIELMRHAYTHRDEVKAKGAASALHVQENWLWRDKIKLYEDALAKHL